MNYSLCWFPALEVFWNLCIVNNRMSGYISLFSRLTMEAVYVCSCGFYPLAKIWTYFHTKCKRMLGNVVFDVL